MSDWQPTTPLGAAVWAAGFDYDPDQDIIYSRMDALQRRFGYAYGYDAAALGMSSLLDCEPIFFDYAGKHWMIELWKGQYGLESGCEIGVYTREIGSSNPVYAFLDAAVGTRPGDPEPSHNLFYDCAADEDMLPLSLSLQRDGQTLFTRSDTHWWLTGFKWGVLSTPSDLSVDLSITLKDDDMLQAFMAAIEGRPYPNLQVQGTTVSFTFEQPFAPQPPAPEPIVSAVSAANSEIVQTYDGFGFPNNDPNQVSNAVWSLLQVTGLELLQLADYYGRIICANAPQALNEVVSTLTNAFAVGAQAVEQWASAEWAQFTPWVAAIEQYLGLRMDFSCYVEIDNTRGASDLSLVGQPHVNQGNFIVTAPQIIPKGTTARVVLQDPKLSAHGSDGSLTFSYADAGLNVKTVTFAFECPTGSAVIYPNKASSSQSDWARFAKSGDPSQGWSSSVPRSNHPLYVGYVIGGGQPS